jgi:alanine-glyoxylate transaminase/serine-glyoxylate transaminase/serine-pyruvate transaminase
MGPGPSNVHPRVLQALSAPVLGHLDPQFLKYMEETKELLRSVFNTSNPLTIPMSGTGSSGMETCLVNLLEPGDKALVCINGVFGTRMADIVERCGATLHTVESPWGSTIDPQQVSDKLQATDVKLVAVVHAETSTGAHQPLEELSEIVHEKDALFVVDMVTSLGGVEVKLDDWAIDAAYSGTQKCLSCPPGLSPISFSQRALEALQSRKHKVQSWYLDLSMISKYWGEERVYHHTAPINMIYALREALRLIDEEGLEARYARHRRNHEALVAGLNGLGLSMFAQEGHRLPMLNSVRIPEGVDDAKVRQALLHDFGIEIGGGLGPVAGQIWRIGLMGHTSTPNNVMLLLAALEKILRAEGHDAPAGAGIAAAACVYSSH